MIAVLGSIDMDVVVEVDRIPSPGETVLGKSVRRYPGGKGANQAVAAARMGSAVEFFGLVGDDNDGNELIETLAEEGVNTDAIERVPDVPTGMASIHVDQAGENVIAYTPGANAAVDAAYVDRVFERISKADVLLMQFEIPLETIAHLLERLPATRPVVIVDPAPPSDLRQLPIDRVDYLTPNRAEILRLAPNADDDLRESARRLIAHGVRNVICKLGDEGALWVRNEQQSFPAPVVSPVDTTAAGDAFNGAFAAEITRLPVAEAIGWANAAGALTVTRRGAQPSLPSRADIEALVAAGRGETA